MDKEQGSKKNYWILDGDSRTYDLREEIKAQGGRWNNDFKCWMINNINKDSDSYKILKSCGLILQPK